MNQGWVKLHRKLLDHPRASDPFWFALWGRLLLLATHQPIQMVFGKDGIITLKPGQFITSRPSLQAATGIDRNKIERLLTIMETEQQIEQRKTSVSRLITILNWGDYQECEQPSEQQVSNDRATSEQRVSTNKNIRTEECKKNNNGAFTKPTVEDLRKKCSEIGLPECEGERFFNFYESNGWRVGKNPMKSWEAAMRNWKTNFFERSQSLFPIPAQSKKRYTPNI